MADDPFAPVNLFAFPVYSSVINGFEEHREPLVRELLDLRARHPGVVRSNRNAWHSGDELRRLDSPHVAWVLQKVTTFAKLALAKSYNHWATSELVLSTYWANVLEPGGWNAPHHHFPSAWSGVYYISVGVVGNSRDDMSGMIEFLNPTPWLSGIGRGGNFVHGPKDGLTLLFPASIYHFVHPTSEGVRVSIAYNFNVVPKAR